MFRRLAACFTDHRDPRRIEHTVEEMVSQRVLGLACGYEDLNDHDSLRDDVVFAVAVGKEDVLGEHRERERDRGHALSGKSTLNRLELTPEGADAQARYKKVTYNAPALDTLMVDLFLDAHRRAPEPVVLDLDSTDTPHHRAHEGGFFLRSHARYLFPPPSPAPP